MLDAKIINAINGLMNMVHQVRKSHKEAKNFTASDKIREDLEKLGFEIKDEKDGSVRWSLDSYDYNSIKPIKL